MTTSKSHHALGALEPIYTLEECAAYLRVQPRKVAELARNGTLSGFQVGRQWRFYESRIRAYIDEQVAAQPSPPAATGRRRRTRQGK